MTKKELKDIILKTLEKEGGAAGIKALAKAAKTSKNKLKKDIGNMSGVKQHQDGDYISTPINEKKPDKKSKKQLPFVPTFKPVDENLINEGPIGAAKACKKCMDKGQCCLIYGSTDEPKVKCIPCPDDAPIEQGKISGGGGVYTQGRNPQLANIVRSAMDREGMSREPMPKQQMGGVMSRCNNDSDCRGTAICVNGFCLENPKPNVPRGSRLYNGRVTRLREIKEIIKTMLDEKKKKKKDRCHRKADQVYGTKTSAYKSGAIVKCRKGMIWKKKK